MRTPFSTSMWGLSKVYWKEMSVVGAARILGVVRVVELVIDRKRQVVGPGAGDVGRVRQVGEVAFVQGVVSTLDGAGGLVGSNLGSMVPPRR